MGVQGFLISMIIRPISMFALGGMSFIPPMRVIFLSNIPSISLLIVYLLLGDEYIW